MVSYYIKASMVHFNHKPPRSNSSSLDSDSLSQASKLATTFISSSLSPCQPSLFSLPIVEAKLQEDFDDANSQAYPRPTQEDFDFKKDLSSWIIQVNIKQSKIFK